MTDDAILVDSSAWIAFFRDSNAEVAERVDRLVDEGRAAVTGVVRAELLQGARSESDYVRLATLLGALRTLEEPEDRWDRVARLGFQLRRLGVNGVGIPDLLVAVTAEANSVPVLTLDTDFARIAGAFPLRLDG